MKVRLRLFAVLRDAAGREEIELEVMPGTTAGSLLDIVVAEYPRLARYRSVIQVAVNQDFAEPHVTLHPADEVALLPPVSGG